MADVAIHYTRPPGRTTVYRQALVHRAPGCTVTLMESAALPRPVRAGGRVILEPAAPVVWFTFDDAWHDIGRFHLADGRFTGWYANILTPVHFRTPVEWETMDLFLDVWLGADGDLVLLDEDELRAAVADGSLDAALGARAEGEAERLLGAARAGTWPPPIAREWPLERARAVLQGAAQPSGGTHESGAV